MIPAMPPPSAYTGDAGQPGTLPPPDALLRITAGPGLSGIPTALISLLPMDVAKTTITFDLNY